jgi:heat shock protein HtpX
VRPPGPTPSLYAVSPADPPANRRAALGLVTVAGALPALVVWVILALVWSPLLGLIPAALVGAGVVLWLWRKGPATVARRVGASPADPLVQPRLFNLVDSLCVAAGVARPQLLIIDVDAPNAISFASGPGEVSLVVTTGLLADLSRVELEGVLAHEVTHLRRGDALLTTMAVSVLSPVGRVAPHLAARAWDSLAGQRESLADLGAIGLTRYPPGLVAGLEKLRAATVTARALPTAVGGLLGRAWTLPIEATHGEAASLPDPLAERLQALREL